MAYRLRNDERGVLIGQTGCGKSTLATDLLFCYLNDYPTGRVVVIDSKPRYRATHQENGLPLRYKRWVKGDTIPNSIAIHSPSISGFKFGRTLIYQSMRPDASRVEDYEMGAAELADNLFRSSDEKHPTLLYIDEYYDLLYGGLAATMDRRLLKTLRAGREKSMAVLIATQRPKSIPLPTLTEASKFYVFSLEYLNDVKYMRDHGPQLTFKPVGHNFVFYERKSGGKRIEQPMRLKLDKES